jgi:hypothetical protein
MAPGRQALFVIRTCAILVTAPQILIPLDFPTEFLWFGVSAEPTINVYPNEASRSNVGVRAPVKLHWSTRSALLSMSK